MPGLHSLPSVKIYLLWETHLQEIVNVFLITLLWIHRGFKSEGKASLSLAPAATVVGKTCY